MAAQKREQRVSNQHKDPWADANPEDILEHSYAAGRSFSLDESCSLLLNLSDAAAKMNSARAKEMTISWSRELFKRARQLPPGWNRAAFEKNALQSLSAQDPAAAFALLPKVDLPDPGDPEKIAEDLRAFAATVIFPRYWSAKGPSSLSSIRSQARQIGTTGEYPYTAMGLISQKVATAKRKDTKDLKAMEDIQSIFREALEFYEKGPHVRAENRDLIGYLESDWGYLAAPLREESLRIIVEHLTRKIQPDQNVTRVNKVISDKGAFSFHSPVIALLYQILPKIQEVDPEWAKKLEDEYSDLKQATANGTAQYSSEMMIVNTSGASADEIAAAAGRGLQAQALNRLRQEASADPQKAASLMSSLTDSEFQSEALASLASGFATKDPDRARDLFSAAQKSADKLPPEISRLRALTSLAEAAAALNNRPQAEEAMEKAFDLGEELQSEELDLHPGETASDTETFDELAKLARFGARVMYASSMARLDHLKDDTLQAFLLVPAAEGLEEKRSARREGQ